MSWYTGTVRIPTAGGGSVKVSTRAWPLAGISTPAHRVQGEFSLQMVGNLERSTYSKLYKTNILLIEYQVL